MTVFSPTRPSIGWPSDVPLVIPEVNAGHLALLRHQRAARGWTGGIVCNTNCTVSEARRVAAPAARPLWGEAECSACLDAGDQRGGLPGRALAFDITDNVLPFIKGEEEKVGAETRKLLGALGEDRIEDCRSR